MEDFSKLLTIRQKKESCRLYVITELTEVERYCTAWNLVSFLESFLVENCYKSLEENEF